jgi:WXG100 family type VII secretion target
VSSTQAEAAVMAQVSSKFEEAATTLGRILNALMVEVDSVKSDWVGRGGASFQQVTTAWGEDQRRLLQALSETATAISTAGRSYVATDDAAADRMKVPGVVLPL